MWKVSPIIVSLLQCTEAEKKKKKTEPFSCSHACKHLIWNIASIRISALIRASCAHNAQVSLLAVSFYWNIHCLFYFLPVHLSAPDDSYTLRALYRQSTAATTNENKTWLETTFLENHAPFSTVIKCFKYSDIKLKKKKIAIQSAKADVRTSPNQSIDPSSGSATFCLREVSQAKVFVRTLTTPA